MEYSNIIKRVYLLSSTLLVFLLFSVIIGLLTHNYYRDYSVKSSPLQEQVLDEVKADVADPAVRSAFFILFLLTFSLFIVYCFYRKLEKTISLYDKKVNKKEEELVGKNNSLAKQVELQVSAVREGKGVIQSILNASDNVAFILTDFVENGQVIVDVSSGVEKILGHKRSEIIGQNPSYLHCEEKGAKLSGILEEKIKSKKGFTGEMTLMKKNGQKLPVLYSSQPRHDITGFYTGIITVVVDISQLHETRKTLSITEERLQQAQKMEAIGTLAGGIAHDFNNVLSSIVGYSELVREQLTPGSQADLDLEQVLHASTRAANLVKQILAFSRKKNMEKSYFEPAIIVKETLKMLRSTIPATIEIQDNIEAEGHTIYANSTQFHQVFMNLCTNGYQAMDPDGGTLSVSLRSINSLDHVPGDTSLNGDSFLELVVTDTGSGIPAEIKDKIFEPFFSTKESESGTGMGLSTVYNIVTKSGGAIWFGDRAEKGTAFHVILPVSEEKLAHNGRETAVGPIPHGSESILFIDDEPEITRMAKAMLESIGYTVHFSNSSVEALKMYLKNEQMFDLIITDQTMPEMTGAELAQNVRKYSATIPIILSTGYSARISEENWMRHGVNGFIMKPFRKREIARLIRETLDKCHKEGV